MHPIPAKEPFYYVCLLSHESVINILVITNLEAVGQMAQCVCLSFQRYMRVRIPKSAARMPLAEGLCVNDIARCRFVTLELLC